MRQFLVGLLPVIFLFACGAEPAGSAAEASASAPLEAVSPLTNYDVATLQGVKAAIKAGDEQFLPAYEALLREADTVLTDRLYAVTDKTTVPPSGDKHDYLSYGPYWWPDTTQPDGLPWIRRDGEVNPLTRGANVDEPSKDAAFANIETLALAAYFSDQEKYAERALAQLRTWFLAPETRMNPNLQFGQGIPGINTGRGIGIIETAGLVRVVTGIEVLKLNGQLPIEVETGLDQWLTDFAAWLMNSEMGIAEREWHNNHGTYYDLQLVVLLRHLGRVEEARAILETAREKRIAAHLAPDGSQPHELERTKSLGYSTMNLGGLTKLAYHGQELGLDLWNYQPADGAGLAAAYAYLQPFVFGDEVWTYEQLGSLDKARARTRRLFYETGAQLGLTEFCALMQPEDTAPTDRFQLLYACPEK